VSGSVAYPFVSSTDPDKLVFTIKVATLATLTPKSFYFVSFTIDGAAPGANTVHGVRMNVGPAGDVTFISYVASTGGTSVAPGPADGRFVATSMPAEPGSSYSPDGTIRIIVKRSDIGVGIGHTLTNWDGGSGEDATATVPGVVSGGAT